MGMNETERATILKLMNEGSQALEEALRGVSEAEASARNAAGGWTIAQIVEHVAVSEELMFWGITQKFRELPEAPSDPDKERKILGIALDRSRKLSAPAVARPTDRFGSLAEAVKSFRECRARTVGYIERTSDDLRRRTVLHPLAGVITGYECLLILAHHPARHAAQIRERRSLELGAKTALDFSSASYRLEPPAARNSDQHPRERKIPLKH